MKFHQKSHFHCFLLHPHEINPITYKNKFIYVTLSASKNIYWLQMFVEIHSLHPLPLAQDDGGGGGGGGGYELWKSV